MNLYSKIRKFDLENFRNQKKKTKKNLELLNLLIKVEINILIAEQI